MWFGGERWGGDGVESRWGAGKVRSVMSFPGSKVDLRLDTVFKLFLLLLSMFAESTNWGKLGGLKSVTWKQF